MPIVTKHQHGSFSWVDLGTKDAAGAKKFYGSLFGWTFEDLPSGPGMTYSLCKQGPHSVCALYERPKAQAGMPPAWLSFVTVDDVDATAAKAKESGGKLVMEPFDVMEAGRMATIQDPSGAVLAVWKANKRIGADKLQEPGCLCWSELFSKNVDAAGKFYAQTFGWTTTPVDMGPMGTYTLFGRAGAEPKSGNVGGMMAMPKDMANVPSYWLAYFAVTDLEASTTKATSLGATLLVKPTEVPKMGRFSVLEDPQGAVFALWKNEH